MLTIASWLISTLPMEVWRKKPFNPVLGETHETYVESKLGNTYFLSEQVSHHPPITAIKIYNPEQQISLDANLSFGVIFGGNSVNVVTNGEAILTLHKLNEHYIMPKKIPNMAVRHLIIGTKKIYWEGELKIICPQTNIVCILNFSKGGGSENVVTGTIFKDTKEVLCTIEGNCGGLISVSHGKEKKKPYLDIEKLNKSKLRYNRVDELEPTSSLRVWNQVSKYILEDKTVEADEAKKELKNINANKLQI